MGFNWKRFNLNNEVKVKLSEAGHKEMERQHYDLYKRIGRNAPEFKRKSVDSDGYSSFQMHTLMNAFGHMMTLGVRPDEMPFNGLDILICDLHLHDVEDDA